MIHDDGSAILDPIIENETLEMCIFDEGDFYTLRKRNEGILKKIDKSSVTEKFWEGLLSKGWTYVDTDMDEEDE